MILKLSVPSKSFLIGEYFVLDSGRALVLGTEPRFEMALDSRGAGSCQGVHPDSPAGLYIKKMAPEFQSVNLRFRDPHEGRGGLGASSAQFLAVYVLSKIIKGADPGLRSPEFVLELLNVYRDLARSPGGLQPSGADLVGQLAGGLSSVCLTDGTVTSIQWPFSDASFFLVRTGNKLATHTHLAELPRLSFGDLEESFYMAESALVAGNLPSFVEALSEYQDRLDQRSLLSPKSRELLSEINKSNIFLVAKACGAMGADTLFLMFLKDRSLEAREQIEKLKLELVATEEDLSESLQIQATPIREITRGPWI
jgi:mevalonate kinase